MPTTSPCSNDSTSPRTDPAEVRLATISRAPGEELRIALSTWKGIRYLHVRLWTARFDGEWRPDAKRGISLRLGEVGEVAAALARAVELLDAQAVQDGQAKKTEPAQGAKERAASLAARSPRNNRTT
jgi:hypothetical protein